MLEVKCEQHLAAVRAHAESLGAEIREQLEEKLSYLEHYAGDTCVCELMVDFAPYSFAFNMLKVEADGSRRHWFNGGLVHHAARSNGAAYPVLAVTISPQDKPHWNIHT
jgi:hypothetical protein